MNTSFYRLLLAAIAALVLHGVFLFWPFAPVGKTLPEPAAMQKIRVSLHKRKSVPRKVQLSPKPQPEIIQKKVVVPEKKKTDSRSRPAPELISPVPSEIPAAAEKIVSIPVTAQEEQPVSVEVKNTALPGSAAAEKPEPAERSSRVVQQAAPLYQINPPPEYPKLARRRGLEGVVVLAARIDVSGHVQELEIMTSSGHKILDQAALKAVRYWLFRPGTIDGQPYEMRVNVPVRFCLR
jgi:protein TonB